MSLIYRGTSSDDVKFNVTERRVYNAPAFDVTGIEVPGRSGDILNSQERFKNKAIVYTGFIRSSDFPGDTTWERLSRGLRTIKAWICGDAGKYHDLTDDYDPGFVRRAFVSGETAISEILDRPDGATITITFMAEPFMYEESDPIELPETGTASGAIASFEGVAAPLQSLKFSIEPKQSGSGDPSPSNIRPISGWSQVDGVHTGDNAVFPSDFEQGSLSGSGTPSSSAIRIRSKYVEVEPNTTYAFKIGDGLSLYEFHEYGALPNRTFIKYTTINDDNGTVTTSATTHFVRLLLRYPNNAIVTPSALKAIRMCKGDNADYTPITIFLGQTVYSGYESAIDGKLLIDMVCGEVPINNNWSKSSSYPGGFYMALTTLASSKGWPALKSSTPFICSHAKTATSIAEYQVGTCFCDSSCNIRIMQASDTLDTWKAYLQAQAAAGTPVQVCCELATPIEVDLTPVSGLTSLLGQNNIWCNTGDTEVVYVEPTENPTEWPSKPRLEITMAGAGTLTVNGKTWSIGAYTGTLICDSEIMDWYDASNLKNSLVSGDGFPELQPGENVITYTGGITNVVAKPRWRTL